MPDLSISDVKTFIGAKNFDVARDFYLALGWRMNFESPELAEFEKDTFRFYLQRYYQKDWCENSMVHVTVGDAAAWCDHIKSVLSERDYGEARVQPPTKQDYGALVTFLWDPSGVLWHLAQPVTE